MINPPSCLSSRQASRKVKCCTQRITFQSQAFADKKYIFSGAQNPLCPLTKLKENLTKRSQCAYQWKMLYNPDVSKQAQEVIFSRKKTISDYPIAFFNDVSIKREHFFIINNL